MTAYGKRPGETREFMIATANAEWGDAPDMLYGAVPEAQREANARLIAAAPDLLSAVYMAKSVIASLGLGASGWRSAEANAAHRELGALIARVEANEDVTQPSQPSDGEGERASARKPTEQERSA